jgi:glycosyltransferase involved in cell wall biosynthesis
MNELESSSREQPLGAITPKRDGVDERSLRVLFFVEGFTDIRFVVGLAQICSLTMAVPSRQYRDSGLKDRVEESGARLNVEEIPGGRLEFQLRAFRYLWSAAKQFDCILSQEMLRGALNANLAGALQGIPVVTYMAISPLEYFRCRLERGQIGRAKALTGEIVIRALTTINGRLAARCIAMGPYLRQVAMRSCARVESGLYYGVDTVQFRPADPCERLELRRRYGLPIDPFLIVLSSRISHEKDPETVLRATAIARSRGLDAVVLNLGGGYRDFLKLAKELGLPDIDRWVLGRPAVHPMRELADYFRMADVLAMASLAEGAGISPLEALACGTPVVATAVGGLAMALNGYARLTPRRDPVAMANELLWVAAHKEEAAAQALKGRSYVAREWARDKAFSDLSSVLKAVCLASYAHA